MEKKELKIAIVSDLHCRHGKESQISTHLYSELARNPKEHHPVEALKQLITKESLKADILLCPGDLTDKADPQGLTSGWGFIKEINKELKSSFYTSSVGNHDVNSRTIDDNPFQFLTSFTDDFPINNDEYKNSFWSMDKNYFKHEGEDFILLNFNSAYNHLDVNRAKKSIITDDILSRMEADLTPYKNSNKIKIALFHHHPKQFANIDQFYKDGDLIERGDQLLTLLQNELFDLVIHGHKHIPKLEYYNSTLPVFCAGSFASTMNILDVSGKNTFHIINISKEAKTTLGTVHTWEFAKGNGWSRSSSKIFFPWTTGFGYNNQLINLENKILKYFEDNNVSVLYFEDLIKHVSEIKYLIPSQQKEISRMLNDNHNIEFIPELQLGPKMIAKQIK